jgi:predicted DNA-binding antitoxin AbrB/MazE fold protein
MTQVLKAIYDGKVFRPEEPVNLKPDSEVQLLITTPDENKSPKKGKSLLRSVAAMNMEGPSDWSEHFEDYLNGTKRVE